MPQAMTPAEILEWLLEEDEERLEVLWALADRVRRETVGDEVRLRGVIEISNICARRCAYCGLTADNPEVRGYRMSLEEIVHCAGHARELGCGTIVLQSGESSAISSQEIAQIIREIKVHGDLAVTLSLGERNLDEYKSWRGNGADRYLLKFETSDKELYDSIHPSVDNKRKHRIDLLPELGLLGYEVGSGIIVGLPRQTWASVVRDICVFAALDLDMVAIGPYVPAPNTLLAKELRLSLILPPGHVPNTELATLKTIALARLVCPEANIPATSALATLGLEGYKKALCCGANVVMLNCTPSIYRRRYAVYPSSWRFTNSRQCRDQVTWILKSIGRKPGSGRGDRKRITFH